MNVMKAHQKCDKPNQANNNVLYSQYQLVHMNRQTGIKHWNQLNAAELIQIFCSACCTQQPVVGERHDLTFSVAW